MNKKLVFFLVLVVLLAGSALYNRYSGSPRSSPFTSPGGKAGVTTTPTTPGGKTGIITTGTPVTVATASISPAGGVITVTDSASPLAGLEITVPASSYGSATQFRVSSAPVEKHTFGEVFNPVTPMIIVDNGGGYSQEVMEVKVPVKVPPGQFAMGFIYDNRTKQLEGLPLISQDENSITVATQHFSSLIFSSIDLALLYKDIDSGFRPGVDDWQFTNFGSYIEPGGHCSGQSMTAMWYYITRPDGKGVSLWGRYDNNGNQPATPKFWRDDSLGYRFSSVVQRDHDWESRSVRVFSLLSNLPEETWRLFAYSMLATGEPQLAGVYNTKVGGGHALVVYRISGGNLYVADPNYPGMALRRIEYTNGKFKPYSSGANAEEIARGNSKEYDLITYYAKTALVDWGKIGKRWEEVKNKTIGNDYFPSYEIRWVDDRNVEHKLEDGFVSPTKLLHLSLQSELGEGSRFAVYRDGNALTLDRRFVTGVGVELIPGNNLLGIWVLGLDENQKQKYIDFKYFNVAYNEGSTPSAKVWTLTETLIFPQSGKLENGKFKYSVTAGSITRITSELGSDGKPYELTATFNFEKPPAAVRPGEVVTLKASGIVSSSPGARPMTPNISGAVFYKAGIDSLHKPFGWAGGSEEFRISGPPGRISKSSTVSYIAPELHPEWISIDAYMSINPDVAIRWVYRAR